MGRVAAPEAAPLRPRTPRRTRVGPAALLLAALCPAAVEAQLAIALDPSPAPRGSLIRLTVVPSAGESLSGMEGVVAGEPLHFQGEDGGTWTSLAGIPVSGGGTEKITLVLLRGDYRDTVHSTLDVVPGDYPVERLRVAPRMAEPDSAARVRIAREIARARRVSRAAHDTPRLWQEPFQLPVNSRITSSYGTGREFNGKIQSRHLGTDFNGRAGDPVYAPNAGRVVLVANFYLAGRVIYLDHGEGLVSAYFHLSRARVKVGDEVARGQLIGEVGQSGRVTGPHLHWVTRYGTTTVDPMSVMALLGREVSTGE